jgi:hypothetical protein
MTEKQHAGLQRASDVEVAQPDDAERIKIVAGNAVAAKRARTKALRKAANITSDPRRSADTLRKAERASEAAMQKFRERRGKK